MKKSEERVVIVKEHINYLNEVIDSTVIAEFLNIHWAKPFIIFCYENTKSKYCTENERFKIEFAHGSAYITKNGENQYVKSLMNE